MKKVESENVKALEMRTHNDLERRREKGITLIALIVTIIVLVILSAIGIKLAADVGIIQLAINSTEKYTSEQEEEKNEFEETGNLLAKVTNRENGNNEENNEEEKEEDDPTKYRINNKVLSFDIIVTVGRDESIQTVKEAFDFLYDNGYKTGGAIVLKEGNYDMSEICTGSSSNINSKYNEMSISIIAEKPGSTYIKAGEMMLCENNAEQWIELKFYRLIFEKISDRLHLGGDTHTNEYYNCVFLTPVGGWKGKVPEASANSYNCVFLGGKINEYDSYPLFGVAENCASNTDVISPGNGTRVTCLTSVAFDEEFEIISGNWENAGTGTNPDGSLAHIGVYGGEYAWETPETKSTRCVLIKNGILYNPNITIVDQGNSYFKQVNGYVEYYAQNPSQYKSGVHWCLNTSGGYTKLICNYTNPAADSTSAPGTSVYCAPEGAVSDKATQIYPNYDYISGGKTGVPVLVTNDAATFTTQKTVEGELVNVPNTFYVVIQTYFRYAAGDHYRTFRLYDLYLEK